MKNVRKVIALSLSVIMALSVFAVMSGAEGFYNLTLPFAPCDEDTAPSLENLSCYGYTLYALDDKDNIMDYYYDEYSYDEILSELEDYKYTETLPYLGTYDSDASQYVYNLAVTIESYTVYGLILTYTPAGATEPTMYCLCDFDDLSEEYPQSFEGWLSTAKTHYIGYTTSTENFYFNSLEYDAMIEVFEWVLANGCTADYAAQKRDESAAKLNNAATDEEFWASYGAYMAWDDVCLYYNLANFTTSISGFNEYAKIQAAYYKSLMQISVKDYTYIDDGYTCGFTFCSDCYNLLAVDENGNILKEYDTSEYIYEYFYSLTQEEQGLFGSGVVFLRATPSGFMSDVFKEYCDKLLELGEITQDDYDELIARQEQYDAGYIKLIEALLVYCADEIEADGFVASEIDTPDEPVVVTGSSFTCPLCGKPGIILHSIFHILYALIDAFFIR